MAGSPVERAPHGLFVLPVPPFALGVRVQPLGCLAALAQRHAEMLYARPS